MLSYVLNIILNVSLFACTPVTHVLKITRRGEGGGGGGAHTWRWMTQNPRRNRELMAGSLALVNAFLPNNSRQPRREEGKEGGEQNLILPLPFNLLSSSSSSFSRVFLAPPCFPPPPPSFFSSMKSLSTFESACS